VFRSRSSQRFEGVDRRSQPRWKEEAAETGGLGPRDLNTPRDRWRTGSLCEREG
jgi:hypothetical protein